jgi:hypothetical protein
MSYFFDTSALVKIYHKEEGSEQFFNHKFVKYCLLTTIPLQYFFEPIRIWEVFLCIYVSCPLISR